jgi:glycolate oxidase iron-sulfur subunit
MTAVGEARQSIRRNIDAWWPLFESGVEGIVMTASGCGVTVREYGQLLADDPEYADKAQKISAATRDLSEIVDQAHPGVVEGAEAIQVAFHSPCTLQHGQQIRGKVESTLERAGFPLVEVADSHLCCGAAGTYSMLQPDISGKLLGNRLRSLQRANPDVIVTANIGCQVHLESRSEVPVLHWIELMDNPGTVRKTHR